jgi:hypothetical protein
MSCSTKKIVFKVLIIVMILICDFFLLLCIEWPFFLEIAELFREACVVTTESGLCFVCVVIAMQFNKGHSFHEGNNFHQFRKGRKIIERKTFETQQELIENNVTKATFQYAAQWLNRSQYDDVVCERSCDKRCGYPLCSNALPPPPKERFRLSRATNTVEDLTERNMYCSDFCNMASNFYRQQLNVEPAYMRPETLTASPPRLPQIFEPSQLEQKRQLITETQKAENESTPTQIDFKIVEHFDTESNTSLPTVAESSLSSHVSFNSNNNNNENTKVSIRTQTSQNFCNHPGDCKPKDKLLPARKKTVKTLEEITPLIQQPEVTFHFSHISSSSQPLQSQSQQQQQQQQQQHSSSSSTLCAKANASTMSSWDFSEFNSETAPSVNETQLREVASESDTTENMSTADNSSDIDPNDLFSFFFCPSKERIELPPLSNFALLWMCLESWITSDTRHWPNNSSPSQQSNSSPSHISATVSNIEHEAKSRTVLPPVDNLAPDVLRRQSLFTLILPSIKKLQEDLALEVHFEGEIQSLLATFDFSRQPIPSLSTSYWMLLTLLLFNFLAPQYDYLRERLTDTKNLQLFEKYNICKDEFDVYMQLFQKNT